MSAIAWKRRIRLKPVCVASTVFPFFSPYASIARVVTVFELTGTKPASM